MEKAFNWLDPLGISVILFLIIGALWLLIGAVLVPIIKSGLVQDVIFLSHSTDEQFFEKSPQELLENNPPLAMLRTLSFTVIAGFLVVAGLLFVFIAWFGLRSGYPWALISLTLSGFIVLSFWALALRPYFQAEIRVGLFDLPPLIITIPGALIIPAAILGWMGLRYLSPP